MVLNARVGRLASLGLASALSGLLAIAPSARPADNADGPSVTSVILNPEKRNAEFSTPALDRIKKAAEAGGVSLKEAIHDYLAKPAAAAAAAKSASVEEPDGPVSTPSSSIDQLTAGEIEDIEAMAAGDGVNLEEALNRYGWQEQFIAVADELEAKYPDTFAGAEKLEKSAWFAFKGAAPADALELASSLPVPVEVVSNKGYSEAELAAGAAAEAAVWAAKADVKNYNAAYDIRSGEIRVEVEPENSEAKSRLSLSAVNATARGAEDERIPVVVNIVEDAGLVQEDGKIRGGGLLTGCTAGFNLKYNTSNTKRLGTAGHCTTGSSSKYANHPGTGGSAAVDVVWSHQGGWGDIGYTTHGGKTPTRTFYHDWNKTRYVDKRSGMPAVGTSVCHFGIVSGKKCSTVKYRDVTAGVLKHLVLTKSDVSEGGDSGGPWYVGGTAVGIHTGTTIRGGAVRSVFTPAYLYQNRGFDVWRR